MIKGDVCFILIVVVSIIVKVIRDWLMEEYDELYFGYGFKNNVGYGIKEYFFGLEKYGVMFIYWCMFVLIKDMI